MKKYMHLVYVAFVVFISLEYFSNPTADLDKVRESITSLGVLLQQLGMIFSLIFYAFYGDIILILIPLFIILMRGVTESKIRLVSLAALFLISLSVLYSSTQFYDVFLKGYNKHEFVKRVKKSPTTPDEYEAIAKISSEIENENKTISNYFRFLFDMPIGDLKNQATMKEIYHMNPWDQKVYSERNYDSDKSAYSAPPARIRAILYMISVLSYILFLSYTVFKKKEILFEGN